MSENDFKITSRDEFLLFLGKAYWLETQFENIMQWEAYMTVKKDIYRNVLFQLSHDSEKHKEILKKFVTNLNDINTKKLKEQAGMMKKEFNFKGKWDEEILTELLKNEYLALDIYTKLYTYTDKDLIKKIWKGKDSELFFKQLKFLIKEEKKHINLLTPLAGKLERIL